MERATKGAKWYLCMAVPAAGGLSRPEAGAAFSGNSLDGGGEGDPVAARELEAGAHTYTPNFVEPSAPWGSPAPPAARHAQRPGSLPV